MVTLESVLDVVPALSVLIALIYYTRTLKNAEKARQKEQVQLRIQSADQYYHRAWTRARADECEGFIGLGFAGSNQASFFCKAQHIRDVGWKPIGKTIMPVTVGETIHKIGRTTEYTSGQVVDDSAYGRVNYGGVNYVEFDDVILTTAMLEGGDSGDSAWKSITMMN